MVQPWLGTQQASYESLLGHQEVPHGYTSKVAPNQLVFPGESMVNISTLPNTPGILSETAMMKNLMLSAHARAARST